MHPTIIIDGDDTLWQTQSLYDEARAGFVAWLGAMGVDPLVADALSRAFSIDLIHRINPDTGQPYGFTAARFPASFVMTVRTLCPDASIELLEQAHRMGCAVFDRAAPAIGGAEELLGSLKQAGYKILLLTKGEENVQRQRAQDFAFIDLIDDVIIVPSKDTGTFRDVIARYAVDPGRSFSLGDSVASDILPALAAGLTPVLLRSQNWSFERARTLPEGILIAQNLAQALHHILTDGAHTMNVKIAELEQRLKKAWSKETSSDPGAWTPGNPAWGQCAVTACIVQDEMGGDIVWAPASVPGHDKPISHYFNKVGGEVYDLTRCQFPAGTIIPEGQPKLQGRASTRDYVLDPVFATRQRYDLLVQRLK